MCMVDPHVFHQRFSNSATVSITELVLGALHYLHMISDQLETIPAKGMMIMIQQSAETEL